MENVTQSTLRKRGGTTGFGGGIAGVGAALACAAVLLSPPCPAVELLVLGFFGFCMLILRIQFSQKSRVQLLRNERRLSIQKFSAGRCDRCCWPRPSRSKSPNCSRQKSASTGNGRNPQNRRAGSSPAQ